MAPSTTPSARQGVIGDEGETAAVGIGGEVFLPHHFDVQIEVANAIFQPLHALLFAFLDNELIEPILVDDVF